MSNSFFTVSAASPFAEGDFYVGMDVGRKRDHSVISVIKREKGHFTLVQLKRFPLQTEYVQVVEYLSFVAEQFRTVRAYYIDETGVGDVFVENVRKQGLKNVQGIVLTLPKKQELMTCLKQVMEAKRLHIPKDKELISEMSAEIAELTKSGKTKFYHRSGTHDDRLWALALAVYGARNEIKFASPLALIGKSPYWRWFPRIPRLRGPARAVVPAPAWDDEPTGPPRNMCVVCGLKWVAKPGEGSPCEHVTKDGTQIIPRPQHNP